jgi:hypothetical protein
VLRDVLASATTLATDTKRRLPAEALACLSAVLGLACALGRRHEGRVHLVKSAGVIPACRAVLVRRHRVAALTQGWLELQCAALSALRTCAHAATNSSHFLTEGAWPPPPPPPSSSFPLLLASSPRHTHPPRVVGGSGRCLLVRLSPVFPVGRPPPLHPLHPHTHNRSPPQRP